MNYKALRATEENGKLEIGITNYQFNEKLNSDQVLIKVQYSSLNYKDAMALNSNMAKIMRKLPMSPGIDLSGTVEMSSSKNFNKLLKVNNKNIHSDIISEVERSIIQNVMIITKGNQLKASEMLGLNRNTLRKKIGDLNINIQFNKDN